MPFFTSPWSYRRKSIFAECLYLLVIGVLSPLAVGLQTFSFQYRSYTFSYVLLNALSIPVIILFYRIYLPRTFGKKRFALAVVLFPIYLSLYELSDRLSILLLIHLPFIPGGYKEAIKPAIPENFWSLHFNENFGYTALVLLAATSLYILRLLFKNKYLLDTIENQKLKMELQQLKSQLQPHFFFNTINNMYSLSVNQSPKTPDMIKDLSGIMRYMLYDSRYERVPLQQEVDFIRSYIRLENLRHNKEDIIDFSIQGEVAGIVIEPLLFLPIIENAFKHSLHKDLPDKWVKIIIFTDDKELILQISNPNYAKLNANKASGGIGLANIKKRLGLLYPGRHELTINDTEESFTVVLSISLN